MTGQIFNIQKFSLHDGPGIRTTVFMKGCPLRCKWCANPESQRLAPCTLGGKADSRPYTVEEAVTLCLADAPFYAESGGGVTISGGEPLVQLTFTTALLQALKAHGIHTAVETTGYADPEGFDAAAAHADLLLYDVKHYDAGKHCEGTGISNVLILSNLRRAFCAGKQILPRIPVIPGYNDALEDAAGLADCLLSVGAKRVQLLPFHQFGEHKYEQLGLPYAMRGIRPPDAEALKGYRQAFLSHGIEAFF